MRISAMRLLGGILLAIAVSAVSCRQAPETAEGRDRRLLNEETITVGGNQRTYYYYTPQSAPAERARSAVFVFHGGEGSGRKMAQQTGLVRYAHRQGFLVVFPNAGDQWDDGRETTESPADDVGFINALVDRAVQDWGVEPSRVYATGASNGGMFTMRLACERPALFTAYATAVANLPQAMTGSCQTQEPVPLLMMNGTADRLMPWDGGEIPSIKLLGIGAGGYVTSTPATLTFWQRVNGCRGDGLQEPVPDRTDDGVTVVKHSWTDCTGRARLIFYEMKGGGHGWPGSEKSGRGQNTQDIDASRVVVDFFKSYGL